MNPTKATGAKRSREPVIAPVKRSPPRLTDTERLRLQLTDMTTRAAPYIVTIDAVLVIVTGVYALIGSINTFQGEGFLLVVGGLALILFGLMMLIRWNLSAVRTGMIGLTAGYFASALTEFQVATDPCDIAPTLARCAGHVAAGTPWIVYQGPLILAMLLFVFIAFEPLLKPGRRP